ncbi:MAG: glycosyltransferase family 4 protein [Verrucomicrobiales bacterium]|nr:glycosyltransferase family 4 protein [Verrucomicrobiales bacterium]
MRILLVTPLYPPLHAGTFDYRAQSLVDIFAARGRQVRVLTSNHGLQSEQLDEQVERRLVLSGAFGYPKVTGFGAMEELEAFNHHVLKDALTRFAPDAAVVWSLEGLSKSLIFGLYRSRIPTVYGVVDDWLVPGIQEDEWLRYWNAPGTNMARTGLELSGKRHRLDSVAPTRLTRGYDRMPEIYGAAALSGQAKPNSAAGFRFDRLFFGSQYLKDRGGAGGFVVAEAPVLPAPVLTHVFHGEVKPAAMPMKKALVVGPFTESRGLETTVAALKELRGQGVDLHLTAYGKAESALAASVRSLALQHRLTVDFQVPSDHWRQLPAALRQHDLLIFPSDQPEGGCLLPTQAMACGLPVVGTRLGAAGEWLVPDETALVFNPGDAMQLAGQLARLHRDPGLRERLASAGQARVLGEANETTVMDRLEVLIEEARTLRQLQ